jgi:hypothetical protein
MILEVRILKELEGDFSEVRILKELRATERADQRFMGYGIPRVNNCQ